jgi:hypothetical protein
VPLRQILRKKGCVMARIPAPRGKGEPPQESNTMGNLDAPAAEELVPLNFKVPATFLKEFKNLRYSLPSTA